MFRLSLLLALVVSTPFAHAQDKRPLTFEDLWKVQRVGKPAMSPDGKTVVVEVTSYDLDADTSSSNLWLLATDGSSQKQAAHPPQGERTSEPRLVAGRQADRLRPLRASDGDVPQIHVISPDGGEAKATSRICR